MTLISAMKFSQGKGAIISDEQSSNHIRKYDIAKKLHQFNLDGVSAVVGGSGNADFLYKIITFGKKEFDNKRDTIKDSYHFVSNLGNIINSIGEETLDGFLKGRHNLSLKDVQKGMIDNYPINSQIHQSAMHTVNEWKNNSSSGFLCLTYDNDIDLYIVSNENITPTIIARPYACIGSGADLADPELLDFIKNIPRDERDEINSVDGLVALLQSTQRASELNQGVGGSPYLSIIDNGKIIVPDSKNISVAGYITKGIKKGYLPKEFCDEAIQSLLIDNEGADTAKTIREDIKKVATDYDAFMDYLLGI